MSAAESVSETPREEFDAPVHREDAQEEAEPSTVEATERSTGSVKWFSVTKGFGFIQPDVGEGEIFVHQTSITVDGFRSLREGEQVEFDLEISEDGRAKAMNVTGPGGEPPQGAPRRVFSAAPFPTAQQHMQQAAYPMYNPYAAYQPLYQGRGAGGRLGRGMAFPARGGYPAYGRGYMPLERPPPPGTPGISSGFQVVVHNLPWSITWQELKDIFSHTPGVVRADVIIDATGRSRGFGTVRYRNREEAMQAAEMMNNAEIGGRVVSVRIDRQIAFLTYNSANTREEERTVCDNGTILTAAEDGQIKMFRSLT